MPNIVYRVKPGDCTPPGAPWRHSFSQQDASILVALCPHMHLLGALLIIRETEAEVKAGETIDLDYLTNRQESV